MARPDGEPKLPGAVSGGPLAYSMRRFQGKGSQERGEALKAFLPPIPDLSPPLRGHQKSAWPVWHQIARRRSSQLEMGKHTGKWRDNDKKAKAARDRRLAKQEAKAAAEATAAAAQAEAAQKAAAAAGCRESTRKRPAPAAEPTVQCGECDPCGCCGCDSPTADPSAASPESTIEGLRKLLAAAEAAQTAKEDQLKQAQAKAQRVTAALAKRERGPEAMAPERLLEAFADTDSGQPRESADAVERAKQRAVKKVDDALPQDLEQRAVVLDALLRRPGNREAAAEAGIRTAADFEFAEAAMTRAGEACAAIMAKKGMITVADSNALDTFLTFVVGEANWEARQRGKAAKRAAAKGEEVPLAAVTGVRAWAKLLNMSEGATWRHLRQALQKRAKLDSGEEEVYWQFTSRRKGHGLSEEVVRMVHDFYVAHPSIKRSPIAGDVLKIKQADGSYVLTAKLLSEISLTDVFLDFQKEYPDVRIKERSFRYLRPVELRRMKTRHLEMCGCRQAARPPSLGRARPPGSHTT
jgi:hypothetical protein